MTTVVAQSRARPLISPGDWTRPISRAIGGCGLNASPEGLARTPQLHQTRVLQGALVTASWVPERKLPERNLQRKTHSTENGCLFSGAASGLDAFSPYPAQRGCPAMPYRTTGTPEAAASRSSRTEDTLPSDSQHPQQIKTDLSHDGLNPAHVPF